MRAEKKQKQIVMTIAVLIVLILCFYMLIHRTAIQNNRFVYEKHHDDTVLTVEEEKVSLREFGYYIYEVEQVIQKQAVVYNEDDPSDYWNTHFSAGMDSTFMSDYARKIALNNCVCDLIYEKRAQEAGMKLTESEKKEAEENTAKIWKKMTAGQKKKTGLQKAKLQEIELRKSLVAKYAAEFLKQVNLEGYEGEPGEAISGNGEYFQKEILPGYHVEYNDKLIEELKMGTVTVN